MKNKLRYSAAISFFILFMLPTLAVAQKYSMSNSVNRKVKVPSKVQIDLSNYSADMKIITTDENIVIMVTDIKVDAGSKEDAEKVVEAIKDLTFELHGNTFQIDTRFYKNRMNTPFRSTMTLENGDKVNVKDFEVHHELRIPKSASLKFDNKYSDIELGDLDGETDFTFYSSNLHAGNLSSHSEMSMKYSKAYFENIGDMDLDLYDSDIVAKECGDIDIVCKYSGFEAKKAGNMKIDSYDDKFELGEASGVEIDSKYSDFEFSSDVDEAHLNFYDSNFSAQMVKKCSYSGKYSELSFSGVKEIVIPNSYDDRFILGKTKKVVVTESKYSEYELLETNTFILDGYDDNIKIGSLSSDFEGPVDINGKYAKISIDARSASYQLLFNIKYPKIDIPDNLNIVKRIEKNSNLELETNNTGGKIKVAGYEMAVRIQ